MRIYLLKQICRVTLSNTLSQFIRNAKQNYKLSLLLDMYIFPEGSWDSNTADERGLFHHREYFPINNS